MEVIEDTLSESIDAFLEKPLFAHLATASTAGPRESPVWFLWEDGAIWVISEEGDSFPGRIERDPRCAIGIVEFRRTEALVRHVGIRGRGRIEALDLDRAKRLLIRYLGSDRDAWDPMFEGVLAEPEEYLFVRIEPETIVARDQSYGPSLE
jgi:nitroimidazol reductase NimA-like FMN-containing flavoprotein (pyridoxamine 5'-phosphate oxidase superfamily)